MDLHGNDVHHVGHGHPRLVDAVVGQIESLPFTPRGFTDEPAIAGRKDGQLPEPIALRLLERGVGVSFSPDGAIRHVCPLVITQPDGPGRHRRT
ncbi:MAG: hypothetical protein ACREJ0_02945 [Geminicoccaceae bacterium]